MREKEQLFLTEKFQLSIMRGFLGRVQWLEQRASIAEVIGSILSRVSKIPQVWDAAKKKKSLCTLGDNDVFMGHVDSPVVQNTLLLCGMSIEGEIWGGRFWVYTGNLCTFCSILL